MTDPIPERTIKRILVALDASPNSLAGLEAAVELAAKLEAELLGLFVEDINLLRLADMPFAHEVGHFSALRRKMDAPALQRELKTQANWARQALRRVAEAAKLRWTFQVVQGSIPLELIAATGDADLIILGKTGWTGAPGIGSTAQTILTQASKLTLVLREGIALGQSVMVVYDGSPAAQEALNLARQLIPDRQTKMIILLITDDREKFRRLQEEVETWSRSRDVQVGFRWLTRADAFMVCSVAKTEDSGVLVVPKDSDLFPDDMLVKILNDINCPVMFVRRPQP